MDLTSFAQLKELGIALVAVLAFGYITKYTIDKNKQVFDSLTRQLKENREDYTSFVKTNNHQNTERIEKSTESISKVAQSIEAHTRVIEAHTKVIERLADKI